jgi:class 3 adenylate cyclase
MRACNDSIREDNSRPKINMGCGITMGKVTFVHYPFDNKDHSMGQGIHEAARIEGASKRYDARVLISQSFFDFIQVYINKAWSTPRILEKRKALWFDDTEFSHSCP